MTTPVITREHWLVQPWQNGRGTTHEVFRDPPGSGAFDVRVSIALVEESGPFSLFPGYRRFTFLVGPAPIHLAQATSFDLVAPGDHASMPGDVPIEATVRAPTRLLNVLVRDALEGRLVVGFGPTPKHVTFVFDLATTEAVHFATPTQHDTHGCVWLA